MKNKLIKILLCNLFLLASCGKDYIDYEAPGDIADTSWIIGYDQAKTTNTDENKPVSDAFSINIDTHISFIDLSQGYQEHRWIIEKGNHFLREKFTSKDSLPLFIKNNDTITDDIKAHVFFRNSGLNKVRLFNTYKKPVSLKTSLGTYKAKQVDDVWVVDTTFVFDVYGHIKPAFAIKKNNGTGVVTLINYNADGTVTANSAAAGADFSIPSEEISLTDESTWPTVTIEAADGLIYEDVSEEGRPNSRRWASADASPTTSNVKSVTMKYFKLGTYHAGTITANRVNIDRVLPTAEATATIPLKVEVIQSTQPFVINGTINEDRNETLRFQVTGVVKPFTGQESFFTVHVTNDGYDQNIPVSLAKVSDTNETFIELSLSEPIYNSDKITVNYQGGEIYSSDDRKLADFDAPKLVKNHFDSNILSGNYSFEDGNSNPNHAFSIGYNIWNNNNDHSTGYYYERSTEAAAVGTASLKFETDASGLPNGTPFLYTSSFAAPSGIPVGLYKYAMQIRRDSDIKAFVVNFNRHSLGLITINIENVPMDGKFHEVAIPLNITEAMPSNQNMQIRIQTGANAGISPGAKKMFIDEISFIKLEPR
ncbi:SwmB domain-containing protein [Ochrovirga pacifica]|uniref:SwmB domain-containing protein n=1 Tax=Ochrovirga pacifica TaxID=1042376 RepID=UPI000255871B|nr:SwmB domain-containing protein [Ochrovirga pacifica]